MKDNRDKNQQWFRDGFDEEIDHKTLEEILWSESLKIDHLQAPPELEILLREALENSITDNHPTDNQQLSSTVKAHDAGRSQKNDNDTETDTSAINNIPLNDQNQRLKKRHFIKRWKYNKPLIAAMITLVLMFSYSYDTLAYYGKKMFGYDTIITGNIEALNEEGAGQEIKKSYTFNNGISVTLDGIMFDENELVAFYKIESPNIKVQDVTLLMEINGINPIRYPASGGRGFQVDEYTQVWVQSFQAPKFYEKWLSLDINLIAKKQSENGRIKFTLDRSKAMKRVVKQEIDQNISIDGFEVHFTSLTASRLNTTIQGTIEPPAGNQQLLSEYAYEHHPGLRFDIFIDDRYYSTGFAGLNISNKAEFSSEAMGLPEEFRTVDIRNIRLTRIKMVDSETEITTETKNLILDDDLLIKRVEHQHDQTLIHAQSKGIPVMGLFVGGEQAKGENEDLSGLPQSKQPVVRAYRFDGKGENMKLLIKAIEYSRYSEDHINIKS